METENVDRKYKITVEPILFSFVFTGALSDSVITNLLLRQVCWYDDGLPLDQCNLESAQKRVSYFEVYKMLIETIVPTILSLFIGSWSDTNGRKMIMIVPLLGHVITYSTWTALSLITNLNPVYLLLSSLGVALAGGFVSVYIGCFCYLSDVTNESNRAVRMGIAEAAINIGQLSGFFISPYLFQSISNGYWLIFIVNATILTLNVVYITLFLPETVDENQENKKRLFDYSHLVDMYKAVVKKRSDYGRAIILLVCSISFLSLLTINGEASVKYMSTMIAFHWNIHSFNLYNSLTLAAVLAASSFGLWFGKSIWKCKDLSLLLISIFTRMISGVLMAISSTAGFFYFGTLVGSLKSFTGPLVRSHLSQIVKQREIGKVFSFLSTIEAITQQIAVPIYATIYAEINDRYPLLIYLVSSGIFLIAASVAGIIMILKKMAVERAYRFSPDSEESM